MKNIDELVSCFIVGIVFGGFAVAFVSQLGTPKETLQIEQRLINKFKKCEDYRTSKTNYGNQAHVFEDVIYLTEDRGNFLRLSLRLRWYENDVDIEVKDETKEELLKAAKNCEVQYRNRLLEDFI